MACPTGRGGVGGPLFLSVVTVPSDLTKMTANLKAPIVINMNTKKACQLIVNNDNYEVRYNVYDYIQKMKEEK